jgi:hypothetical protein
MGYDISQETHERIEKNRRDGRLCQGSGRCSTRATKLVQQRCWPYRVGEGDLSERPMVMCAKHASEFPAGYVGVNFEVVSISSLPRYKDGQATCTPNLGMV